MNGTYDLVVYYGTWHGIDVGSDFEGELTQASLSLYSLKESGSPTDVEDYIVEEYGLGGRIKNDVFLATNPPYTTDTIKFDLSDYPTKKGGYKQSNNGKFNDIAGIGFIPGENYFFADNSKLYESNVDSDGKLINNFSNTYGHQSH